MKTIKVRMTLIESMLGTSPNDEDIFVNFVGSKAPNAETRAQEVEALGADAVVEKGMTVFPRSADGEPILWDYQIKGFFKDSCSMLARVKNNGGKKLYKSAGIKAYKKVIDGMVFPAPREIVIHLPDGEEIDYCQRPLRAQTAQGERVALAISERVPAGSWFEFEVVCLDDDHIDLVKEWLDYAKLRGFGQWRNSGCGRATYEILEEG